MRRAVLTARTVELLEDVLLVGTGLAQELAFARVVTAVTAAHRAPTDTSLGPNIPPGAAANFLTSPTPQSPPTDKNPASPLQSDQPSPTSPGGA